MVDKDEYHIRLILLLVNREVQDFGVAPRAVLPLQVSKETVSSRCGTGPRHQTTFYGLRLAASYEAAAGFQIGETVMCVGMVLWAKPSPIPNPNITRQLPPRAR